MKNTTLSCCFDKDSMAATPSGEKYIRDIQIGEKVSTPDGEDQVINVSRGFEENLVCVESIEGRSIRVTPNHPMMTNRGFVRASKLNTDDDLLILKDGSCGIKSIHNEPYNDAVYNIETQNGQLIVNGFIVGDITVQNTLI